MKCSHCPQPTFNFRLVYFFSAPKNCVLTGLICIQGQCRVIVSILNQIRQKKEKERERSTLSLENCVANAKLDRPWVYFLISTTSPCRYKERGTTRQARWVPNGKYRSHHQHRLSLIEIARSIAAVHVFYSIVDDIDSCRVFGCVGSHVRAGPSARK